MQLPYPVHPPVWSSHGYHALNTRPFLAVHRHQYGKIHRLFPATLCADQLRKPISARTPSALPGPSVGGARSRSQAVSEHGISGTALGARAKSPGLSDEEEEDAYVQMSAELQSYGPELRAAINSAKFSARRARYIQRESWRFGASDPFASPLCFSIDVLQAANFEQSEYAEAHACLTDHITEPQSSVPYPRPTGNPLVSVKICNEFALACSLSGFLGDMSVYQIKVDRDETGGRIQKLIHRGQSSQLQTSIPSDTNPITDVVTSDAEHQSGDPAKLAAVTETSLSFASIPTDKDKPQISWFDSVAFSGAISCSFNPMCPDEFAVVSEDGLHFGPVSTFHQLNSASGSSRPSFHDVQVIARDKRFSRLFFGSHPRTLLLSSRREVVNYDLRERYRKNENKVMFNTRKDWNLPAYDSGIAVFHPVRSRGFQMLLATQTRLNYFDVRMPHSPLLDWSLTLPLPVDQICVANLHPSLQPSSDVVALASRKQNYLELFHGIHVERMALRTDPLQNGQLPHYPARDLAKPTILWSDLPWSHLTQLKPVSKISGMALVPQDDYLGVSLVQWSATDGLVAQLLDVRVSESDNYMIQPGKDTAIVPDNATKLSNHQRALVESGDIRNYHNRAHPVTQSEPGSFLHSRTWRVFAQDAYSLRERICRPDEDDVSEDGNRRLPRTYMGDIPNIRRLRAGEFSSAAGNGKQCSEEEEGNMTGLNSEPNEYPASANESPTSVPKLVAQRSGPEASEESGDRKTAAMGELMDELESAKTLEELARHVRSGMPHNSTPLGYSGLADTIEASPFVELYKVNWHTGCEHSHRHSAACVDTDGNLPSWVSTKLYVSEQKIRGEAIANSNIPQTSEHGLLLSRMKYAFFDEDIPEDVLKANADHGITALEAQGTPSSSEIERDGAASSADEDL